MLNPKTKTITSSSNSSPILTADLDMQPETLQHISKLELCEHIALCQAVLAEAGLTTHMSTDMHEAYHIIRASQLGENASVKPYLTDFMNPDQFTYTSGNCFWVIATNKDDKIIATVAFRLDTLGTATLRTLHDQILRFKYPDEDHLTIDPSRLPPIADSLNGTIAFVAELWMDPKHSGRHRANTIAFASLTLTLALLNWPNLDHIYGFVRNRDAMLGAVQRYGFAHSYPGCLSYSSPISQHDGDLYFVHNTHSDVVSAIRRRTIVRPNHTHRNDQIGVDLEVKHSA